MSAILTRFRIEALHGFRTIDIPITDNTLILVGENGTGKSTVANLLYFFLTCQWNRMLEYDFESISAVMDGEEIIVTRHELTDAPRLLDVDHAMILSSTEMGILLGKISSVISENLLTDPARFIGSSHRQTGLDDQSVGVTRFNISAGLVNQKLDQMRLVSEKIKRLVTAQVLYLPTYRRIEQDLQSIFPAIFPELKVDSRRFREWFAKKSSQSNDGEYVELVEFGMGDVERAIQRKMDEIKDRQRNGLSHLTGRYLRDVIQGAYQNFELSELKELATSEIEAIFSRIDEKLLPEQEQQRLRDIVAQIHSGHPVRDEDKVVGHFLIRLLELHKAQQEHEKDVREFVRLCNLYLKDKKMVYDDLNFKLLIEQAYTPFASNGARMTNIAMSMLSSGEKQIVSFFSHFYLSGEEAYFVIIDEPELSLSVPWQKRFLPDILASSRCTGLIAVTHSPFIFDNHLDHYTHALTEFMEPVDDVS